MRRRYRHDHKDAPEVKARLTEAFKALRKQGYVTRQSYLCCGSCAASAIGTKFDEQNVPEDARKAVYFSRQGGDHLMGTASVHISWNGNGQEIVDACKAAGLGVNWDGDDWHCVEVFKAPPVAAENLIEQ